MDLPTGSADDLCDEPADPKVRESKVVFDGMIFDVRRDEVELGEDDTVTREYVQHPGAVVIVALREIDGVDHIVVIRQYRHPVRTREWELPAGILDEPGEDPRTAAARELAEEVELSARRWDVLLDFYSSPGMTSEALRVFLAREVEDKHDGNFHRTGEEAGITGLWIPLDQAHTAVLAGQIHNPGAVIGILAAWGARQKDWSTLRPADSPWPWYA